MQQLSGCNAPDLVEAEPRKAKQRVEMKISFLKFFFFFKASVWDIEVLTFGSHCIIAYENVWKMKGNEIKLIEV